MQDKFKVSDVFKVLKMPGIWLISIVVITCYSVHLCSTYMTPYFTNVIGASASIAAILAIFRNYILQFLGGPLGGFLAEKLKSTSKVVTGAFVIMLIGTIALVVLPASPDMMIMLFVTLILVCGSVYIMKGIYFALISEIGVSLKLTGTAIGAVSMIGFAPDIFMNPICGALIDAYPGAEGYHVIFLITLGLAAAGLIASAVLYKMSKKKDTLQETGA